MYYEVNGVGWTWSTLNYADEKLERSKKEIMQIWIDKL